MICDYCRRDFTQKRPRIWPEPPNRCMPMSISGRVDGTDSAAEPSKNPGQLRILGIDPSDPEAEGGITGAAILECFTPLVIGSLDRGVECEQMLGWIERHGVTNVAVEVALDVFQDAEHKGPGARRNLTRRLLRANTLAGRLLAYAEIRLGQAHVHAIDSRKWRKLIGVNVCKGETTDHAVARALRLRVPSWPKVSNAHERDAAGVALGVSVEVEATRASSAPRLPLAAAHI